MSGLEIAWGVSLIVTLTVLPVGVVRMLAYRSRQIDHTETMQIVAWFALGLGTLAFACLLVLTLMLLAS